MVTRIIFKGGIALRNMLKLMMNATNGYVSLKRELLGVEPNIFLNVAEKCGFEAIHLGNESDELVTLRRLGIPKIMLYDADESNEFCWLNVSDFHVGHPRFDEDALLRVLEKYYNKVKNSKHKYVFIAGDSCNAVLDDTLSYELVKENNIFWNRVKCMYDQQSEKLFSILSRFPLDYIALNGNHEYMFVQLGLPSPLEGIENRMRALDINYRFYDTYMMDFIIAGVAVRIMHLEGHLFKDGRNPIYERINEFRFEKNLVTYYNGKKYPVRFIQSGHRHKKQILYDPVNKIYVVEAGSFIKDEMYDTLPSYYLQGTVSNGGILFG